MDVDNIIAVVAEAFGRSQLPSLDMVRRSSGAEQRLAEPHIEPAGLAAAAVESEA